MDIKIPDNLQFVILGNVSMDELMDIYFPNTFLAEQYPEVLRSIINPDKNNPFEEIIRLRQEGKIPFVVTTDRVLRKYTFRTTSVLAFTSVSDLNWENELGQIDIEILNGGELPDFEEDIQSRFREFTNAIMLDAQETHSWMEHRGYQDEIRGYF